MSTTLPLFWHLSSGAKKERLDASVQLITALEHFQSSFVPKPQESSATDEEDEDDEDNDDDEGEEGKPKSDGLDALNAQDVSYSIRRLVRGLASPRESSRLGFAVALTQLLSAIDTVTCSQITNLIMASSQTHGSMTGQEERDVLFARLFGLTAVIQSGLLLRDTTLPTSSTCASDLNAYTAVLTQLVALGEKKSWLRESAWWTLGLAVDALHASDVSWKDEAADATVSVVYADQTVWTPEKVAMTLKLQAAFPARDWRKALAPTFKQPDLLATGNLATLARILKESDGDEEQDSSEVPKSGAWKPQVHFVWDMLLARILPGPDGGAGQGSFPDFFRIVVDESLFASTSSSERKYWGFQIFRKALPRVKADDMGMLFTRNFMRSWINHLSNSDRYLHKAARQVATDMQAVVKTSPTIGFALMLQLTGAHGSRQFDKLTKTKTVETILTSMDEAGIERYIEHLLKQADDEPASLATETNDIEALNARRAWVVDQFAALVRNGAIPKKDAWVQRILDWLVVHGLFVVTRKSEKSPFAAVRAVPTPPFSEELRKNCRDRLLSCLAELTAQATVVKDDSEKSAKIAAVASDGTFWVARVLASIEQLEKDAKHVKPLAEIDEEIAEHRQQARQVLQRLREVKGDHREEARGVELLLCATLVHHYCAEDDDADPEALESCIDAASRMFPAEGKKRRKAGEDKGKEKETPTPIDVLVDTVIGFLEKATAYMRAVANQVFALISSAVQESTIELILTQLERRDPAELVADEDEDMEDVEGASEDEEEEESSEDEEEEEEDDEDDADDEEALELRRKIEEALRVNGIAAATGDSDDESEDDLMDDDQMLAIDEQLAAAFRARATERKGGKDVDAQREATHFKNRVLDLLDIFLKKHPTHPLAISLVLPLVELTVSTGPDEKQLADKATSIMRARIGKAKEIPAEADLVEATKALEALHALARKASAPDVLATLNQCSVYVSKVLLHQEQADVVLAAYQESLKDFVTRKNSRLNTAFFDDLVKRHPQAAWGLRDALVGMSAEALNGYRQAQVFHLILTLVNQLQAIDRSAEAKAFMPTLRTAIHDAISKACDAETLTAATLTTAQAKEVLKLALVAVRQSKRFASSQKELAGMWQPPVWSGLVTKLAESERFKASVGLQAMCKQIVQIIKDESGVGAKATKKAERGSTGKDESKAATKRKVEEADEEGKKAKRKKARKAQSA